MKVQKKYSLMPLRDVVMFPYMVSPLFVGREPSIKALEYALEHNQKILLVSQKAAATETPTREDIYEVGVLASILQMMRLPDKTVKVLVEGVSVVDIKNVKDNDGYFIATVEETLLDENEDNGSEISQMMQVLQTSFEAYVKVNSKIPNEIYESISLDDPPDRFAYNIAANLNLDLKRRQEILSQQSLTDLLAMLIASLEAEIDENKIDKNIRARVKKQMDKSQREYYLNEKIKAIHKELGDKAPGSKGEMDELREKIKTSGMSEAAMEKLEKELSKLKMMSPNSAEATVVRSYIDAVLEVPWKEKTKINHDIVKAGELLDLDHYGLEEVKERILEYLAVQQRVGKLKGPILCLVGPPGVGKTSLGESIAQATGRKFVRMSLGGVRDEAEIRGHRRTYIGSMPGKIVQNMTKVGVKNPLFLLDEIDKMAMDFRGDPSSALLEVLDPEQNHNFNDHYLEVDYDLSDVMFVATSNSMNIPGPLLDRMEVIRISGYTEDEKRHIAKHHLISSQLKKHGLTKKEFNLSDAALVDMIQHYTREAGVRGLDREIAKVMRKAVTQIEMDADVEKVSVSVKNLEAYLGVKKFRHGTAEKKNQVGQVTGLAWTSVGGELLTIEGVLVPGKGKFTITGQLGEVMQESIQAAMSVLRSRADSLGIDPAFHEKQDIHIHVPEGATPKDGPSAGVGMCTALASILTGIKVRASVAMTGEITLRGEVLPIGGLKEKLLAAHRGGIKTVIIPHDNEKDLKEIPDNILAGLEIVPVQWIDEVWERALVSMPKPKLSGSKPSKAAAKKTRTVRAH